MEQREQKESEFGTVVDNIRRLAESVKGIKPEQYSNLQRELQESLTADELYALEELASITKRSSSNT